MTYKNTCLVFLFAVASSLPLRPCRAAEGFFIPSVAFSRLVIEPGAWCRYLVTEESMGGLDSSTLYIAVPADGGAVPKGCFWLEFEGEPLNAADAEPVIVKLLVSEMIRRFSPGDSLGDYVSAIYIKEGDEPVREGDLDALPQLERRGDPGDSSWVPKGSERLETRAGAFQCDVLELRTDTEKRVPAKGTTFITKTNDIRDAWFSRDVPLFNMIRYSEDRLRETRLEPPIAGVPVSGARALKTRVEIIGYGTGAGTLMPAPVPGVRPDDK
jgi:hypothetical protein